MNKESDNTREEVELSQLVGAIIRDVAKARVQADQYSHLLSEKYKEKEDNGEQLVSFPVPRAEISDVEVKFKFAVSEIKEAPDSTETKIFFFNKVLEKYTPILTEKYFFLCNENKIKISPQKEQSYQINIRDSIAQWIKEKFICKESEDKKNLQIQKSEKINDLADALKKIPIPLSNIFEEIQNKTHPIANDIINLYKKNPESFQKYLTIDNPELLSTDYQKKIVDLCDTVKKIAIELRSELDSLHSKFLKYRKSDGKVIDLWDAASSKKSRKERDATFDNFIFKYNQKYENISPKIAPKIWRTITPNPSEKYKDYPRYRLYINDFNVSFDVGTHKGFGKYNAEKENINIKILPLFFSEFEKYLHVHFEPVNRSSISPIIFNIPISTANMSPQKWEVTNGNIKEFTNQLHSLEQQSIDAEKEENLNTIQEVIKKDEVIESTIGEISNVESNSGLSIVKYF